MSELKKIKSALISVYYKDGLESLVMKLAENNVKIYSTGGTKKFIEKFGISVTGIEDITLYPSILGGRVKTLHPKVFGGILARREVTSDLEQLSEYQIPEIDMVVVDLYPFVETTKKDVNEGEIIEKIDIGGISLIRAAAKNFYDVLVVSSRQQYFDVINLIHEKNCHTNISDRRKYAIEAFQVSSDYDSQIFNYFNHGESDALKISKTNGKVLRYGENPHQSGKFYGDFDAMFDQLNGKDVSYNNLLDIDAAVDLIAEFSDITFAIIKHNNACGLASDKILLQAWKKALAGDPVSAFGGVLITNAIIDQETATEINKLFFEIIIAPDYEDTALEILKQKKNRIILTQRYKTKVKQIFRSVLDGILVQGKDLKTEIPTDLKIVTKNSPSFDEIDDLLFANKLVKHSKSNAIVLAKNKQLLGSGVGQTSRIDALKQAIHKAETFGFSLKGAVMASDAFFPFSDSVEIAHHAGILSVIQPGGSVRDKDSIDFCNSKGMAMVFTGNRHFKH